MSGIENELEETPNPEHVGGLQPVIKSVNIGEASLAKDPHFKLETQASLEVLLLHKNVLSGKVL